MAALRPLQLGPVAHVALGASIYVLDLGYPPHQAQFARSNDRGTSLQDMFARFPNEDACVRYVFEKRFGAEAVCPCCGIAGNWRVVKGRRRIVHRTCKWHIAPFAGTAMDHSRIPTQLWLYAMLHLSNSRDSSNAYFFERHLGVAFQAAHRLLKRIRLHLTALDYRIRIGISGAPVHIRIERFTRVAFPLSRRRNAAHVLFFESDGWVDSVVLERLEVAVVRRALRTRVHEDAQLFTTCAWTARVVQGYGRLAGALVELKGRQAPGDDGAVDPIDGFVTSFRRGARLQHQTIPHANLWLYLREYQFRYNRRNRSAETFWDMVSAFPLVNDDAERAFNQFYHQR